jgi:predicted ATP-dependent protease
MPRRRQIEPRKLAPDPVYNSTLAEKFINCMTWDGKKMVAQHVFYEAMGKIQERTADDPLKVFKKAVEKIQSQKKAIEEKVYRSNLIQEKIREMIERRIILIDTDGEAVGQVNGLFVMGFGDFSFGAPSRVTASIGLGREGASIFSVNRKWEVLFIQKA